MFGFFKSPQRSAGPDIAAIIAASAEGQVLLVDVREADELRASGKAKGAVHMPLSTLTLTADPKSGNFNKNLAKARKDGMPIYVYCASGARSVRAIGVLKGFGFDQVDNLGGLQDWVRAGGAVTR